MESRLFIIAALMPCLIVRSVFGKSHGITNHLGAATFREGNELKAMFINAKTFELEKLSPPDLIGKTIAFPGQFDMQAKKFTKLNEGKVDAVRDKAQLMVSPDRVDYIVPSSRSMFSVSSNMMPFIQNSDPNRMLMANKHFQQTVPLLHREKPLVASEIDNKAFEEILHNTTVASASPVDGTVKSVTKTKIVVTDINKEDHTVQLLKDYPLNSEQFYDEVPAVKVGDKVKAGDALVDTNFSKDRTLALGTNLRMAFMPYRGLNIEDAIVISESAATKLSSEHKHELATDLNAKTFQDAEMLFVIDPEQRTRYDAAKFDEKGLPKVGAKFHMHDIVVPLVREVSIDENSEYARIHKKLRKPLRNASLVWEEPVPGTVVYVHKTNKLVRITLKTLEPAQIGDKASPKGPNEHCLTEGHDVLTYGGWKPIADVTMDDLICTLDPVTQEISYQRPSTVERYDHDGPVYLLESQQVSVRATASHHHYVAFRRYRDKKEVTEFCLASSEKVYGNRVRFAKSGIWIAPNATMIEIPGYVGKVGQGGRGEKMHDPISFPAIPFLKFLGFFIGDGYVSKRHGSCNGFVVGFGLSKQRKIDYLNEITAAMGVHVTWCSNHKDRPESMRANINNIHLAHYLRKLGKASEKSIPNEILQLGRESLLALYDGLMNSDGHKGETTEVITTTSLKLRDQWLELALKLGWAGNFNLQTPAGTEVTFRGGRVSVSKFDCWFARTVKTKLNPQVNHGHTRKQNAQTEDWQDYSGPVFDIRVPNGIFYIRRNGRTSWTGGPE